MQNTWNNFVIVQEFFNQSFCSFLIQKIQASYVKENRLKTKKKMFFYFIKKMIIKIFALQGINAFL